MIGSFENTNRHAIVPWLASADPKGKGEIVQTLVTQYLLKGFRQEREFRVFVFDVVEADSTRSEFTVKADLALSRQYGIRLQELPLLCRCMLERRDTGEALRAYTCSEKEMSAYANLEGARLEAARAKRAPRRPVGAFGHNVGVR